MHHEQDRYFHRDTSRSARIRDSFAVSLGSDDRTLNASPVRETKPISWKQYCSNRYLPKLMTIEEIIKHQVNKEEDKKELYERKLLIIKRTKMPFTPASAYAFGREVFRMFLL